MESVFIDCHTHQKHADQQDVFALPNVLFGQEALPTIPCTVGIHPWYIDEDWTEQLANLAKTASSKQVLAIGECGLDKLTATAWEKQIAVFEAQIQIAKALNKPLILHTVRSYDETLALLKLHALSIPVVFHGFQKNEHLAKSLLDKGYYLSLGASILNGNKDALIKILPLDRLLFETGDKSISIIDIYTYFCSVRGLSIAEVKNQIQQNFQHIFNYRIF